MKRVVTAAKMAAKKAGFVAAHAYRAMKKGYAKSVKPSAAREPGGTS